MSLETDSEKRKEYPIYSGVIRYFPDALAEIAKLSKIGNDKHNPGEPLHWARGKSTDELDALVRHLAEAGTLDTDGLYHDVKVAWRALANLQKLLEEARGLPVSPGSRLPEAIAWDAWGPVVGRKPGQCPADLLTDFAPVYASCSAPVHADTAYDSDESTD